MPLESRLFPFAAPMTGEPLPELASLVLTAAQVLNVVINNRQQSADAATAENMEKRWRFNPHLHQPDSPEELPLAEAFLLLSNNSEKPKNSDEIAGNWQQLAAELWREYAQESGTIQGLRNTLVRDYVAFQQHELALWDDLQIAIQQLRLWVLSGKLTAWGRSGTIKDHVLDDRWHLQIPRSVFLADEVTFIHVSDSDWWIGWKFADFLSHINDGDHAWGDVKFFRDEVAELVGVDHLSENGQIANAITSRQKNAPREKVISVVRDIYHHAAKNNMKPPNKVEIRKPANEILGLENLRVSESVLEDVCGRPEFETARIKPGRRVHGRFLAFSLEGFRKSGPGS